MLDSASILKALRSFGPIEWFKISVGRHPLEGYFQAPFVVWRFHQPPQGLRQVFEAAVSGTNISVKWTLDISRKNWLLTPSRLLVGTAETGSPGFSDVAASVALSDQPFCIAANADLEDIVSVLEEKAPDQ
ncbi:hypothetical protein GCM10010359_35700 [Streptomyces morookaense]|nr:hypothetical protein GCM10010359_35700 [Streptomyces morookaense]